MKKQTSNNSSIRYCQRQLDAEALRDLIVERCALVVVKEFMAPAACEFWTKMHRRFLHRVKFDGGANIARTGNPWFTSKHGAEHEHRYFLAAAQARELLRNVAGERETATHRAMRQFDLAFSGGAVLGKIDGVPMHVGLARLIDAAGPALPPHQDAFGGGPDGRDTAPLNRARAVLFGNVYHACDGVSGALLVWDKRLNKLAYQDWKERSTGYSIEYAAPPVATYTPEVGDLVLGFADKLHAVETSNVARLTESFFVAIESFEKPSVFYS